MKSQCNFVEKMLSLISYISQNVGKQKNNQQYAMKLCKENHKKIYACKCYRREHKKRIFTCQLFFKYKQKNHMCMCNIITLQSRAWLICILLNLFGFINKLESSSCE